ncbi:hypothetical protein L9F63_005232, partial [Diploptera punctata]
MNLAETKFVTLLEGIFIVNKHEPIVKDHLALTTIITKIVLLEKWIILTAWMLMPIMVRYYDVWTSSEPEIDETIDSRLQYLKYFGIIIWLPPNINEFPTYELVYLFNSIGTYAVASNFEASGVIFLTFIVNIKTHFKILASAIENMDEIYQNSHKSMVGMPEQANYNVSTSQFLQEIKSTSDEETDEVRNLHSYTRRNYTSNLINKINDADFEETLLNHSVSDEELYHYFIRCIKYHQALL